MAARTIPVDRTYLYAPASNQRILSSVLGRGADAVVLDLEDGVAPQARPGAREALADFLADAPPAAERPRLLVRVNRDGDGWADEDLAIAVHPAVAAISLPKVEDTAAVVLVADRIGELEQRRGIAPGTIGLHLLVESAAGVDQVERLARVQRVERFGLGAADLRADLGMHGPALPEALDHVRGRLVVASRVAGIGAPVDSVHLDLQDLDGLRAACVRARAFGFFGKSVVHPAQVAVVNDAFTPDDDERSWAASVVAAAHDAAAAGAGATMLDGMLVDAPVLARARAVLDLVRRTPSEEPRP